MIYFEFRLGLVEKLMSGQFSFANTSFQPITLYIVMWISYLIVKIVHRAAQVQISKY